MFQDFLGGYKLFKVMRCVHKHEGLVLVPPLAACRMTHGNWFVTTGRSP